MSYISDVSVSIGSNVFQVTHRRQKICEGTNVTYLLNGVENAKMPNKVSAFPIHVSHPSRDRPFRCKKSSTFTIELDDTENIKISFDRGFLNVHVTGTSLNFDSASGLIGTWGEQGMVARDGKTLIEDPNSYAQEWQVRDDEPDLFKEKKYPQYPVKCLPPPAHKTNKRRSFDREVHGVQEDIN